MQPNKKFYWFGDSWVYGSELKDPVTECFTRLVSDQFGAECVNLGKPGSSIEYIVYKFMQVYNSIKETDSVFFFLTERSRTFIGNKHIITDSIVADDYHLNSKEWYKYFDCDNQQQYSLDRNLLLLNSICPNARFANIFSINTSTFIEESKWLLPSNQCIAQYVLPHVNKGFILTDHPKLTIEEWEEQKVFVDMYFNGGHQGHPNKQGHQLIAQKLCKLISIQRQT